MSKNWLTVRGNGTPTSDCLWVNVIPLNDLREHEEAVTCPCEPWMDGEIIIHNSWDGREITERAKAARIISEANAATQASGLA